MGFKAVRLKKNVWQWLCVSAFLGGSLSGCSTASEQSLDANHSVHGSSYSTHEIIIVGGDPMLQQWTQEAVSAYCEKNYWPLSLKKITHLSKIDHLVFNQPRKTRVRVSKDNVLHIDFQLGGVLMENFSHELMIQPPLALMCRNPPLHYEVKMQPRGNAVIYISKPEKNNAAPLHVSHSS